MKVVLNGQTANAYSYEEFVNGLDMTKKPIVTFNDVEIQHKSTKSGSIYSVPSLSGSRQMTKDYFLLEFEDKTVYVCEVALIEKLMTLVVSSKTLDNTSAAQIKESNGDVEFFGDGDTFKLISKASSKSKKWMKSTKAMEIHMIGCVLQVTTQQGDQIAEALTFVPSVKIAEGPKGRKLVKF